MSEPNAGYVANSHDRNPSGQSTASWTELDASTRLIPSTHSRNASGDSNVSQADTDPSSTTAFLKHGQSSEYTLVPSDENGASPGASSKEVRASWHQRILLDTWIPEILIAVLSIACVVAILIVLLVFDNKPSPRPPYDITLNAMISILSTASRSMLLYVVAASIGQLKWSWYRKSRQLQDIQTFDDASRGPWGSLNLLCSTRIKPLASIGALITIFALAVDPFVQQIVTYPSREVNSTAAVPAINRAPTFMLPADADRFEIAVEAGIFSDPEQFERQLSCPTGTCKWPEFNSMGWCSQCRDASLDVKVVGCDMSAQLRKPNVNSINATVCRLEYESRGHPDGSFVGFKPLMNLTPSGRNETLIDVAFDYVWETNVAGSEYSGIVTTDGEPYFEAGNLGPVISLMHVHLKYINSTGNLTGLRVTEAEDCSLTLCDSTYNMSVINGTTTTRLLSQDTGAIYNRRGEGVPSWGRSCWQPHPDDSENRTIPANTSCGYVDPQGSYFCPCALSQMQYEQSWSKSLADQLTGLGSGTTIYTQGELDVATPVYQMYYPFFWTNTANQFIASRGLNRTLQGVAASLTRLSLTADSTETVDGVAWITETYVSVRYEWLIFPFALVVSGVTLLLLAIGQSYRDKVKPWKSSILPLLYHPVEPGVPSGQPSPKKVSAMEKSAGKIHVRYSGQSTWKQT